MLSPKTQSLRLNGRRAFSNNSVRGTRKAIFNIVKAKQISQSPINLNFSPSRPVSRCFRQVLYLCSSHPPLQEHVFAFAFECKASFQSPRVPIIREDLLSSTPLTGVTESEDSKKRFRVWHAMGHLRRGVAPWERSREAWVKFRSCSSEIRAWRKKTDRYSCVDTCIDTYIQILLSPRWMNGVGRQNKELEIFLSS